VGDWKNVRHDYYALLLDMFIERWAMPWYKYTEEKNLKWTGHYWEHGWPNPKHGGDNMAMYAWHQYPGVDMLFNDEEGRPDQFGNIRAIKELSSVVNQLGKERALSETYGGSGWELTFEDMKRFGDWEYVLGVNFMNQHLSYMTIKGARKRDFPQSLSYHTPWWEKYKTLNQYFERLSLALSYGKQINKILILEPTSTTWMYFSPEQDRGYLGTEGILNKYRDSFQGMLSTLEKYQVEYDLGSERIIKDHGAIKNSKFFIGERGYDLVVLPPGFENFEPYVYDLIKKYLNAGGKVLSFSGIPYHLDGNISRKMPAYIRKYKDQWIEKKELNEAVINQFFSDENFKVIDPASWNGNIFHQRRQFTDGQLLFIVNYDPDDTGNFHFVMKGSTAIHMDPFNGEIKKLVVEAREDKIILSDQLPPNGSILIFVSDKNISADEFVQMDRTNLATIESSNTTFEQNEPNMFTLDYCDLEINGEILKDIYFYNAEEKIYEHHLKEVYGFNYNPWSVAVQYRRRILDKNNFDKGSGFKAHFPFYIENGFIPDNTRVVIEWPHLYTISCNGTILKPVEKEWWLDHSFGVFNISDQLKHGKNVITIEANPMDIHAELEPVYLTGDFGLKPGKSGWTITEPTELTLGSWKDQGLPFYSASISYIKTFNGEDEKNNYIIKLNKWSGTVAEIIVNGESAGIIGWQPYELDVSEWVEKGTNTIEVKVFGSLKNLLGPHHNNPTLGRVTPWSFFYANEHQPSGRDYHLLDYGLLEDFEIAGL
jgi:hypothetical protein